MAEIAILHDSFEAIGGAEYVAVTIAKIFNAPIYTSTKTIDFYDNEAEIIPLITQRTNSYPIEEVRKAITFQKLRLRHEIVISSMDKVKFYKPQDGQKHINYTYTPPRMFYDLKHVYRDLVRFHMSVPFELYCFCWNRALKRALNNIDEFLCISEVVEERMRRYWKVNAEVLYPPVETSKYECKPAEDFFLYIGRLNPVKRIDIVIDAFRNLDEKLVVIGQDRGNYSEQMEKIANIDYKGEVDDEQKIDLLSRCKGVIYPPMEEDFGLVPIEAFASGKPVIGVKEGYTAYQIQPYKNGLFIEPTMIDIIRAVKELKEIAWDSGEIEKYARQYDLSVFSRRIKEIVKAVKEG